MTGFRLPASTDIADLTLVPRDGPLAVIVHEYVGMVGDCDAKWGEFDNRQPTFRAKLILRRTSATRLAVAFGGRRRANIKACTPNETYIFDLDFAVNSDNGDDKIRVLYNGSVHEVTVSALWSPDEGATKVYNLLG